MSRIALMCAGDACRATQRRVASTYRFCGQMPWRLLWQLGDRLRYLVGRRDQTVWGYYILRHARGDEPSRKTRRERAMGWTDERGETLKKLWLDGLSASQIAKQLGGVTRNAVIGKVHRLGLSGRATPSHPSRTTFKAPRPPRPISAPTPRARALEPRPHHVPAPRP